MVFVMLLHVAQDYQVNAIELTTECTCPFEVTCPLFHDCVNCKCVPNNCDKTGSAFLTKVCMEAMEKLERDKAEA